MEAKDIEEVKELLKRIAEQLFERNHPNTSYKWEGTEIKITGYGD